jgi:hypothetical protein
MQFIISIAEKPQIFSFNSAHVAEKDYFTQHV